MCKCVFLDIVLLNFGLVVEVGDVVVVLVVSVFVFVILVSVLLVWDKVKM